ncbi:MAG TPA: divergent polysaccharide deacetylase family protein, partial [Geminicoccaceae bacterium]|nr:divergent polysaccharide deacetylase family protein [Geminicoccaceae bacterium]
RPAGLRGTGRTLLAGGGLGLRAVPAIGPSGEPAPPVLRTPAVVAELPPATRPVEAAAPPESASLAMVDFELPPVEPPPLAAELAAPPAEVLADELPAELSELRNREMGVETPDIAADPVAIEPLAVPPAAPGAPVAGPTRERMQAGPAEATPAPPRPAPRQQAAVPPPPLAGGARVAIIIDDLGPAHAWSARAMALPGPLTMAFLPYADGLPEMVGDARRRGHEIFLHMPMQPLGDADPGRNALVPGMSDADIRQRVEWAIDRVGEPVGMNNHMGSRMTADTRAMQVVMEVLRGRGLMFVDSRTSPRSVAEGVAAEAGLPHTGRDVFLDHFPGTAFVHHQLAELEARARRTGSAVAIGHPLPATMEVLEDWIPAAKARGLRFVKVSELIAARGCDGRSGAGKCGLLHVAGQRRAADGGG